MQAIVLPLFHCLIFGNIAKNSHAKLETDLNSTNILGFCSILLGNAIMILKIMKRNISFNSFMFLQN